MMSGRLLLDSVPPSLSLPDLREQMCLVPDVQDIHELHVWGLSPHKTIASMHIIIEKTADFLRVCFFVLYLA